MPNFCGAIKVLGKRAGRMPDKALRQLWWNPMEPSRFRPTVFGLYPGVWMPE